MAKTRRRHVGPSQLKTESSRSITRSRWWLYCLAIWMLLLARTPFAFVDSMQLLPWPDSSLLAEGHSWNPPLAYVAAKWQLNEAPYWLASLLFAAGLATAIRWRAERENIFLVAFGMAGLVPTFQEFPLVDWLCLLLVGLLVKRGRETSSRTDGSTERSAEPGQPDRPARGNFGIELRVYALTVATFFAAATASLEFGLIAILLSCLIVAPQTLRLYRTSGAVRAIVLATSWPLLVSMPGLIVDGYFAALLRPLSWVWLEIPSQLLPSMVPVWESDAIRWFWVLLALPVADDWRQAVVGRWRWGEAVNLGVLTWLGLGSVHYLPLAAAAVLFTCRSGPTVDGAVQRRRHPRYSQVAWLMFGVAVCVMLLQVTRQGATMLASDAIRRDIDPLQWNLRGSVLLSNLEQSPAWQNPPLQRRYPLLLTDRWDIHHAAYGDYTATIEDWSHWRREAYLRDDEQWGGYQSRFAAWEPCLVVLDADELAALHRVSVDSKWKVIGIDHQRAVFASTDMPQSQQAIRYAGAMLATLELPRPRAESDFQRVLALGSTADSRRVSAVLTSLRLPYAALRVLPDDGAKATRTAASFAWCELGHRSHRYAGQYSLLDGCRALSIVELDGAKSLVEQTKRYRRRLKADIESQNIPSDAPADVDGEAAKEATVRRHLGLGQVDTALEKCAQLRDPGQRRFYTAIAGTVHRSPTASVENLQAASDLLEDERASECWFYIGCFAIEHGEFLLAQQAFSRASAEPSSGPFAPLAKFYLSQL